MCEQGEREELGGVWPHDRIGAHSFSVPQKSEIANQQQQNPDTCHCNVWITFLCYKWNPSDFLFKEDVTK